MWVETGKAIAPYAFFILIAGWHHIRVNKMEKDRKKELYKPNGQTNYVLRDEHQDQCTGVQETFCSKVDGIAKGVEQLKSLIMDMNKKREETKDLDHEVHKEIGERLARIEACHETNT